MTKRALQILRKMAAAYEAENYDDAEIAVDHGSCWCGLEKISSSTVRQLLQCTAISEDGTVSDERFHRYAINETGLIVARKPELADEIFCRIVLGGKPFMVTSEGLKDLDE